MSNLKLVDEWRASDGDVLIYFQYKPFGDVVSTRNAVARPDRKHKGWRSNRRWKMSIGRLHWCNVYINESDILGWMPVPNIKES